eukprot:jgi/Botrbrau1/4898/Bobra.118_1s0012.1
MAWGRVDTITETTVVHGSRNSALTSQPSAVIVFHTFQRSSRAIQKDDGTCGTNKLYRFTENIRRSG